MPKSPNEKPVVRASIYGLYDAAGDIRYIGKANNPERRLASHMRDARRRRTPLYNWIAKHGRPEMRIIEANCEDWQEAERRIIAEARGRGANLLNVADGGDEPFCSIETRSANGRMLAQRLQEDGELGRLRDMKRRLVVAMRSGYVRNATRERLRAAARKDPGRFGCFAGIQDRVEDHEGKALLRVGVHYVRV